jgi:hypothetical protein
VIAVTLVWLQRAQAKVRVIMVGELEGLPLGDSIETICSHRAETEQRTRHK